MLTRLTNGSSRQVFLIGRYAIKMPYIRNSWRRFIRGLYMNLLEVQIFRYVQKHNPDSADLLCPIHHVWLGGLLLIMPRAATDLCEQDMVADGVNIYQLMRAHRLEGDDKYENFGRLNGRIVKLDYADCRSVFE